MPPLHSTKDKPAIIKLSAADKKKVEEIANIGAAFFFKENRSPDSLRSLISTNPSSNEKTDDSSK
jgi:hypothetical protein